MKNDKKPQVRFKGFNDDWEQRKVSETAEIAAGGTPSTSVSEYWEPKEVPWLSSGEVHKKYVTYTDDMISKLGLSNSSAKMIKENSILIALAGQGKTRGTVAINRISLSTNQSIAAMTFNDDIIPEFVFSNLENRYDEIRAMSSGDGSRGGLNKQLVGNIVIPYTIIEEQRKIGAYFENLDNLITLHQRKCDKLQKIKKSMLEKMFPQNGMKKPEIRFKGFNDDWEQRKVGEFLTESRESGHKGDVAHKMTVKLWGKGVYEKNETGSANTQYFTRHAGQFIYSKLDFLNCAFGVVPEELDSLETTADVPAFDCDGVNPYFMFYTAIQPIFYEKNGMIADGSRKAKRIHANTFLEMPFFVPSLTEQNKIVNLLSELDHLITLHQRKLEKLKYIKKSMLENMFV